jgi:hypothetical protein
MKDTLRQLIKPRFPRFWKHGRSAWKYVEGRIGLRSYPRYTYYEELDVIFISISKNANSTINRMFLDRLDIDYDPDNYHSISGAKNQRSIGQESFLQMDKKDIFVFSFSRNPLTRLASCYDNKVDDEAYQNIMQNYFGVIYPHMPFTEFVKQIHAIPDWWADEHFRSQTADIYPHGEDVVDYMGKIEQFDKDIQPVREKFDLPEPVRTNTSKGGRRDLTDYYTKETAELAFQRYEADFRNFGYLDAYEQLCGKLPD